MFTFCFCAVLLSAHRAQQSHVSRWPEVMETEHNRGVDRRTDRAMGGHLVRSPWVRLGVF